MCNSVDISEQSKLNWSCVHRIIYADKKPIDFIILEDLAQSGFTAARVSKGLTIEQSRIAVEKIAVLHAASVVHLKHVRILYVYVLFIYYESVLKLRIQPDNRQAQTSDQSSKPRILINHSSRRLWPISSELPPPSISRAVLYKNWLFYKNACSKTAPLTLVLRWTASMCWTMEMPGRITFCFHTKMVNQLMRFWYKNHFYRSWMVCNFDCIYRLILSALLSAHLFWT